MVFESVAGAEEASAGEQPRPNRVHEVEDASGVRGDAAAPAEAPPRSASGGSERSEHEKTNTEAGNDAAGQGAGKDGAVGDGASVIVGSTGKLHGGVVSSRSWSSAILPASLSGLSWFSTDKRSADDSGAFAQQEDTPAGLPGEAAEQGGPVGGGDKKNGTSFQVRASDFPSPNGSPIDELGLCSTPKLKNAYRAPTASTWEEFLTRVICTRPSLPIVYHGGTIWATTGLQSISGMTHGGCRVTHFAACSQTLID